MSRHPFWLALALAGLAGTALAKPAPEAPAAAAAAAVTDAEVGDADSFGRNLKWLGLLQTGSVSLRTDCTPDPAEPPLPPEFRCVTLNPAPAITSFDEPDIGRTLIPGKSAHSLICQWVTPFILYNMRNNTGVFQPNGRISVQPYIVVENEVLAEPGATDPNTGLPLAGSFELVISASYLHVQSLQPGDSILQRENYSRVCIGGIITRRMLTNNYGLTDAQAKKFFKKDTVIRYGVRGNVGMVDNGSILYGLRLVGD